MEGKVSEEERRPARILVMEDNPADIALLRLALDHHEDAYLLEVLRDGGDALAFVQKQAKAADEPHPCVIVMDMHLPKHDAPTVLAAVRETPSLAHIKVVVLTSFAAPHDEQEVRRLGIRMYRTKPIHVDEWVSLAGEILDVCHDRVAA